MVVRELRVTGDRHGEAGRYDPHVDGRPSHSFLYSFMNIESPGLWTGSGVLNDHKELGYLLISVYISSYKDARVLHPG